jgi:hypothetical protein
LRCRHLDVRSNARARTQCMVWWGKILWNKLKICYKLDLRASFLQTWFFFGYSSNIDVRASSADYLCNRCARRSCRENHGALPSLLPRLRLFPAKSILSRWPGASSQGLIPNPPSLISITAAGRTAGQLVESRGGNENERGTQNERRLYIFDEFLSGLVFSNFLVFVGLEAQKSKIEAHVRTYYVLNRPGQAMREQTRKYARSCVAVRLDDPFRVCFSSCPKYQKCMQKTMHTRYMEIWARQRR